MPLGDEDLTHCCGLEIFDLAVGILGDTEIALCNSKSRSRGGTGKLKIGVHFNGDGKHAGDAADYLDHSGVIGTWTLPGRRAFANAWSLAMTRSIIGTMSLAGSTTGCPLARPNTSA